MPTFQATARFPLLSYVCVLQIQAETLTEARLQAINSDLFQEYVQQALSSQLTLEASPSHILQVSDRVISDLYTQIQEVTLT